jgi:hypothetical protein
MLLKNGSQRKLSLPSWGNEFGRAKCRVGPADLGFLRVDTLRRLYHRHNRRFVCGHRVAAATERTKHRIRGNETDVLKEVIA